MLGLQEGRVGIAAHLLALLRLRGHSGLLHEHLLNLRVHGLVITLCVVEAAVAQNIGQGGADVAHGHNAILRAVSLPDAHLRLERLTQHHRTLFVLSRADADVDGQVAVSRPRARIDRHKLAIDAHHLLAADVLLGQLGDDLERLLHAALGQVPGNKL